LVTRLAFFAAVVLLAGCATVERPMSISDRNADILGKYPQTDEALMAQKLTHSLVSSAKPDAQSGDVYIMIHPAYSVFFRDLNKKKYSDATYNLLKTQFDNETNMIADRAMAGKNVILVVPGEYLIDSIAPLSYVSYLNTVTAGANSVYYVLSETSSSGTLPMDEMVNLYQFLQTVKATKVMIGGGYIGRCQREFYNQLTTYMDGTNTFLVPEISSISPDDVSEGEALTILSSLQHQDYTPVKMFIDKKTGGKANILSVPQKKDL
jgi:hypothetical protein